MGLAADGVRQPGRQGQAAILDVMAECGTHPEFECFDVGIVRSVGMYVEGRHGRPAWGPSCNFVMGVASGHADADLLKLLPSSRRPAPFWQTTLIGRAEIWPVHQATAELGGMLRTGAVHAPPATNSSKRWPPAPAMPAAVASPKHGPSLGLQAGDNHGAASAQANSPQAGA